MSSDGMFRSSEHAREAIGELADHLSRLTYGELPGEVRVRIELVLIDLFGVTTAGMRTPELRALVESWACPAGDCPVPGTSLRTVPETSAFLSAVAACCLELDEGNKYAAGHPTAHVVFGAIAASRLAARPVSGAQFLTAVAAGYEVAARFGYALRPDPAWHPHGHSGATGAACAAAMILDARPSQVAAAIDSATGLMHVAPWSTVLSGDFTRNLWMAGANLAGLNAARLAIAGLVANGGGAQGSLGSIVGTLDPSRLVEGLGSWWLTSQGYAKRHAACSYTHAAIDIVQSLRTQRDWQPDEVATVRVATHSLSRPLLGRNVTNRLAAMFSLPFVVSTAVVNRTVDPRTMQPGSEAFAAAQAFSDRVVVEIRDSFDDYLPELRCTELAIEFTDGSYLALAQPNPIGDADHFPLSAGDIEAKLVALIGKDDTVRVQEVIRALARASSVTAVLDGLP